jgi:hypothetical protein
VRLAQRASQFINGMRVAAASCDGVSQRSETVGKCPAQTAGRSSDDYPFDEIDGIRHRDPLDETTVNETD